MNIKFNKKLLSLAIFNAAILLSKPSIVNATTIEPVKEERSIEDVKSITSIMATANVNIRKDRNMNSEVLGTLPKNDTLELISYYDGWYKVKYNNKIAYVSAEYAVPTVVKEFPYGFKKTAYALDGITIFDSKEFNREIADVKKYEFFEIYEEYDNAYLVKTNDHIGYIKKEKVDELEGKFIVVDISDQEVKLYDYGEITLESPVVTGQPSTNPKKDHSTSIGLFEIFEKSQDHYLVGPGYKSYVNVMMKFHNGEGLHDAEYYTDANGKSHGWRERSEFGGDTYLTNGSHGCANMPNSEAKELFEKVELGTKVLVKE